MKKNPEINVIKVEGRAKTCERNRIVFLPPAPAVCNLPRDPPPHALAVCLLIRGAARLDWSQSYLSSAIARTAGNSRVPGHWI